MKLEDIIDFCQDAYGQGIRKGPLKLPTFWHSCDVVTILAQNGITDTDTIALAYMHDLLEDTLCKLEKTAHWPHDPCITVNHQHLVLTPSLAEDLKQLTNPMHMEQADRKEIELFMASRLSKRAARVRIADKASNARSLLFDCPADWNNERVTQYRAWAAEVVKAAAKTADAGVLVLHALQIIEEGTDQ